MFVRNVTSLIGHGGMGKSQEFHEVNVPRDETENCVRIQCTVISTVYEYVRTVVSITVHSTLESRDSTLE